MTSIVMMLLIPITSMAQIPGEEDFTDFGSTGTVNEIQVAHNIILDIMHGLDTDEPIANVFDDVPIVVLGIVEKDGKEVLHVGLFDDAFYEHQSMFKEALYERFPGVDFHLEAGDYIRFNQLSQIQQSTNPRAAIPDNTSRQGLTSSIQITDNAVIGAISISVDITHTFRGDLKVDLIAPNGDVIILHNRQGGGLDNLVQTYTTELSTLINETATGTWTLRVGDYAGSDTGTLQSWSITITPQSTTPSESTAIFEDTFENGLGRWTESGDINWRADRFDENNNPPGLSGSNNVAEADNCNNTCILTLSTPINLSSHNSASLQFWRYIDRSLDSGEYLKVEVSTNGRTWITLDTWSDDNDDDDDAWHAESYDLSSYLSSRTFSMRFVAEMSSTSEDVGIDNVQIVSESTPTPVIPVTCNDLPRESVPIQGGDKNHVVTAQNRFLGCSTTTLGGLTVDGISGFVISGHSADAPGTVGNYVVHHRTSGNISPNDVLGRVLVHPSPIGGSLTADAAFAEYPLGCTIEFLGFCFANGPLEKVVPLRIDGETRTYTVTGSDAPSINDRIQISGMISGDLQGTVLTNTMTGLLESGSTSQLHFVRLSTLHVDGDSGAPVYTIPNESGNTEIVGILAGNTLYNERPVMVFSSWQNVETHLGLDPIS